MIKQMQEFLNYLQVERNYSEHTIISYQRDILMFHDYLEKNKLNYLSLILKDIRNYLKTLDKFTNATVGRKLSSLRSFYNYLYQEKVISQNIFTLVENPKQEKKLPNFLNHEEINLLLDYKGELTKEDKRNHAILEMLYATGLRVSELCYLKLQDIDISSRCLKVLGKGKKERIVYFGDYAIEALTDYLKIRHEFIGDDDCNYVFLNNKGGVMTRELVEEILQVRVKEVSLEHHLSPHTLRHTFATDLLSNGADIRTVQELLGHANLSTTQIYTHVTNEHLRHEYLTKMQRK